MKKIIYPMDTHTARRGGKGAAQSVPRSMNRRLRRRCLFFSVVAAVSLLVSLAGCSGGGQPDAADDPAGSGGSPFAANGENVVTGILSAADGGALEIELMESGRMGGMPEGGEIPDRGEMPEGWQPGDGGQPPEGMPEMPDDLPEGADIPAGGFPEGGAGTPPATGESMTVLVGDAAEITAMGGGALSLSDLEEGDLLQIELADDGETAVRISVMRRQTGTDGTEV